MNCSGIQDSSQKSGDGQCSFYLKRLLDITISADDHLMYEEIIFLFIVNRFPCEPIPDIIKYDLHNPVLEWISNLPTKPDISNRKSLRNCYDSNNYGRYVNRLQTIV
jgi:hypothetical protein